MAASSLQHAYPAAWSKRSPRDLLKKTGTFVTVAGLVTCRGLITQRSGSKVLGVGRVQPKSSSL